MACRCGCEEGDKCTCKPGCNMCDCNRKKGGEKMDKSVPLSRAWSVLKGGSE